MLANLIVGLRLFLVLSVLTGVIYPLCVYSLARAFFPVAARGSLVVKNGEVVGSTLIAQKFTENRHFKPRPSAGDYATVPSVASNLGPTSQALKALIEQRRALLGVAAPMDLLTTSGSGIDPHITPEAAYFQLDRVARARNFDEVKKKDLKNLIRSVTEGPQFGVFGGSRVNVLVLNLAMDDQLK